MCKAIAESLTDVAPDVGGEGVFPRPPTRAVSRHEGFGRIPFLKSWDDLLVSEIRYS